MPATRTPHTDTGPGRPGRRTRPVGRARPRPPEEKADGAAQAQEPSPPRGLRFHGMRFTRRALIVVVVLVILVLSYASTLRVYLDQQHDLAVADQEISERSAQIADLQNQLDQWDDPAYVEAQARDRLGWVMPGETGYRVVDENGQLVGDGVVIDSQQILPPGEHPETWWDRLWGSVQTADAPQRKVTIR